MLAYGAGGLLAAGAFESSSRRRTFLSAVALCVLWGLSDEIHQSFVPGRDASGMDLAADATGGALGAALFVGLSRRGRPPAQPACRKDDVLEDGST